MKDVQKPERVYIAVDPSKVARCKWCGCVQSRKWRSAEGGVYCSDECKGAAEAVGQLCLLVLWQATAVFIVLASLTAPYELRRLPDAVDILIRGLAVLVLEAACLWLLLSSWQGWHWRREIPEGSRRDDAALDLVLLRGIATGVECPKCDANLDLTKVGSDMTYRCDYCGATGSVELIKTPH